MREELEESRTAAELLPWVREKMAEFRSTEEGKRAIRFRQGFAKQLVEEALPLGLFASLHFQASDHVTINLVLGNQNYDATVEDRREQKSPFTFIEVTQAHEGENDYLRMLALDRNGHVSAHGGVRKTGTKATGIHVKVESTAQSHSTLLTQELDRIEAAIQRKMGKPYPPDTALVVACNDYTFMWKEPEMMALRSRLTPLLCNLSSFRWLAVVGIEQRVFEEFDLR